MSLTSAGARSSAPTPPDAAIDHTLDAQRAFGHVLKAARERKGLTIGRIAEVTKVCPSHFQALERGDVGHWPRGLFRRAFFRGYVAMVGLPVDETLEEFLRLFPEQGTAPPAAPATPAEAAPPRLALDTSWHGPRASIVLRVAAALVDAATVSSIAIAAAVLSPVDVTTAAALVTIAYFTVATIVLGGSPWAWAIEHRSTLVSVWRRVFTSRAPGGTAPTRLALEDYRMGEERSWTTDAHRIRPRDVPPRIRVRFKLS